MKDIRVDDSGDQRCWNCGGKNFTQQRTMRSKVAFGVGAVLTKKKLRCVQCGEYNDVGNAKPFTGPADRKYRKAWEAEQAAARTSADANLVTANEASTAPSTSTTADELKKLAELRDAGVLDEAEFEAQKAKLLG